jgi:hypothetical protein
MTDKQPEALRLANAIDLGRPRLVLDCIDAAAELRRLHEVNAELLEALEKILEEPNNTMSDGKALKEIVRVARAAIAKATGEQP